MRRPRRASATAISALAVVVACAALAGCSRGGENDDTAAGAGRERALGNSGLVQPLRLHPVRSSGPDGCAEPAYDPEGSSTVAAGSGTCRVLGPAAAEVVGTARAGSLGGGWYVVVELAGAAVDGHRALAQACAARVASCRGGEIAVVRVSNLGQAELVAAVVPDPSSTGEELQVGPLEEGAARLLAAQVPAPPG